MSSFSTHSWSNRSKKYDFFDFKVLAGLTAFIITLAGGAIAFNQIFVSQENRPRATTNGNYSPRQMRTSTGAEYQP